MRKLVVFMLFMISLLFGSSSVIVRPYDITGSVNRQIFGFYIHDANGWWGHDSSSTGEYWKTDPDSLIAKVVKDANVRIVRATSVPYLWEDYVGPRDPAVRDSVARALGIHLPTHSLPKHGLPQIVKFCKRTNTKLIWNYANILIEGRGVLPYTNWGTGDTLFDSASGQWYYENEVKNVVRSFLNFCHYCFGDASKDPNGPDSLEARWARLRQFDGFEEPLDDVIKYISFGNDGFDAIYSRWGRGVGNCPTTPGEPLEEEIDTNTRVLDSLCPYSPLYESDSSINTKHRDDYKEYRTINTYIRIFKMCKDSLLAHYPGKVDFSPNIHNFFMEGGWFSDTRCLYICDDTVIMDPTCSYTGSTVETVIVDTFRNHDGNFIFFKKIAELSDEYSPINGECYVGHYGGNMAHYKGRWYLWHGKEVFPSERYSSGTFRGSDDDSVCKCGNFLVDIVVDTAGDTTRVSVADSILKFQLTAYKRLNYPVDYDYTHPIGFIYRFLRDSLGVRNIRPFGLTEWRIWVDKCNSPNQCGINFNMTLASALGTNEFLKEFMRGYDHPADFPEIEYACFQTLHGDALENVGVITGFGWTPDTACYYNMVGYLPGSHLRTCAQCGTALLQYGPPHYTIPCGTFFFIQQKQKPACNVWKEGDDIYKSPTYYLYYMYGNYFGDILINQDESSIESWTEDTSFKVISVNSARKKDGTITLILMNRDLDSTRTLQVILYDTYGIPYDSIKVYCLSGKGKYGRWDTLMGVWGDSSGYAPTAFMHNNRPQRWANLPYEELVPLDSGLSVDSLVYVVKTTTGETIYAYQDSFISVLSRLDTFYMDLPKHSISAVEIFPHWQIVLHKGWNLISLPIISNDTLETILPNCCDRFLYYNGTSVVGPLLIDSYVDISDSTVIWCQGRGFWVHSTRDTVFEVTEVDKLTSFSRTIRQGWDILGSVSCPQRFENLVYFNDVVPPGELVPRLIWVSLMEIGSGYGGLIVFTRDILPYLGYYMFSTGIGATVSLDCGNDTVATDTALVLLRPENYIELSVIYSEDTATLSVGVSDSAHDYFSIEEDIPVPPKGPWFDPDSDFSASFWVNAPIPTRLSRSVVYDLPGEYDCSWLYITGSESATVEVSSDSLDDSVLVHLIGYERGWDIVNDDSFGVSPGRFRVRQIDLTSAISGPWVYTEQGGSKYYKYWLLDNVILPQQYLEQKYAGVGEDYMFLTTPLAMDEDGVAYLKISGGGKSYPYYDHFNLVAIDIPAEGNFIPALCGGKLSVFDGDSALPLKLAVDDNGDTVTEVLRNDDDWTYVDTGSGSIEIWIDESLYTSGPLFLVFSPPPAPRGGDYSEIIVSYYDYTKKNWVKTGSVLGRIERFPVVEDVYYTSSGEDLRVKLEWNRGIRFDGIYVFRSAVDTAETVKTELISASHSRYGDVKGGLDWKGSLVGVFAGDDLVLGYKVSDKVPKDYVRYWVLESAGDSGVVGSDSFWAEIDTGANKVVIYRRGSSTVIESAWVCIDDGDTGACGYTDVDGIYASPIDLDYTQDIYVSKFGFRPLKVQHVDYIDGNEVWVYDVELLGDAFVGAGDTLIISAGAQVRTASNSDVSTNQDDFNDNRVEIVVKGGHIEIRGTDGNPVVLAPKPGSSSTFQWEGVYCRDGGTANIENAIFKKPYMAVLGYNQPGRITVKDSRIEDLGLIYVDYSQVDSSERVFLAESCYVGNRVQIFYGGDSCVVRACTLNGGYYEGATVQSSEYGMPHYENCHIEGKNYRCVRLLSGGSAEFKGCEFDGHRLYTSQQYFYVTSNAALYLDNSRVDASDGRTINWGIRDLGGGVFIKSRWTTFDHYNTCVQTDNSADFGTLSDPGHNCFLDDDGYAIVNDGSDTIPAEWNYYDTLLFKGSVEHDSVDTVCHPDSTMHRRIVEDNKPTLPKEFALGPAIPNPFNSSVELHFEVPEKARVRLEIWDVLGRRVCVVFDGEVEAGAHSVVWDGKDSRGENAPSGVYFYRLVADKVSLVRRMTLIR